MENWIRGRFTIDKPYENDPEEFLVFEYEGKELGIYLPNFIDYCKGLEAPLTVSSLKSVDPTDNYGWHKFFDSWKQQGILD